MKLTKGRLSKIRKSNIQTRKKKQSNRRKKASSTGKTFRNRKKGRDARLHKKTMRGGLEKPGSVDPKLLTSTIEPNKIDDAKNDGGFGNPLAKEATSPGVSQIEL